MARSLCGVAVFLGTSTHSLGSWTSRWLLCVFGGDLGIAAENISRENLRLPFTPSSPFPVLKRQVWTHLQLDQTRVNLAQVLSARELVEAVLNMHQDEQRKVITFFLYLWWTERCGVREGEKKRDSISSSSNQILC